MDMNKNALVKEFLKYSSLSIFGMLGFSCYILVDTFFVSLALGTSGLTALNIAVPVYGVIHGSGLMLGMGGATRFTIMKNSGETESCNKIFTNTVYIAVLFSVVFIFMGIFLHSEISVLLGADETVFEMTDIYIMVLLLFAPAFIFNDILICFVRNDGSPQLSTISSLSGSVSNIILDYILIFPLKLGMLGAVLATALAPVIGISLSSIHFLRKKGGLRLVKTKPEFKHIKYNFILGFPSFMDQISISIVIFVFNFLMLRHGGNTAVAAYSIIANVAIVINAFFNGTAQGTQPLLSKAYGQGNKENIKFYFYLAIITVFISSIILYLIIFFLAAPISDIFNSENNLLLKELSVEGLRLYFISVFFTGLNIIITIFFTSTEKPLFSQILSLARGLVIIVPMAFIFARFMQIKGIWLSFPVTEVIALTASITVLIILRKKLFDFKLKKNSVC